MAHGYDVFLHAYQILFAVKCERVKVSKVLALNHHMVTRGDAWYNRLQKVKKMPLPSDSPMFVEGLVLLYLADGNTRLSLICVASYVHVLICITMYHRSWSTQASLQGCEPSPISGTSTKMGLEEWATGKFLKLHDPNTETRRRLSLVGRVIPVRWCSFWPDFDPYKWSRTWIGPVLPLL